MFTLSFQKIVSVISSAMAWREGYQVLHTEPCLSLLYHRSGYQLQASSNSGRQREGKELVLLQSPSVSLVPPMMEGTHPEEGLGSGWQQEGQFPGDTAHKSPSRRGTVGFHCESSRSSECGQGGPAQPGYTDMKCLEPKPSDLEENKKPSNGEKNEVSKSPG